MTHRGDTHGKGGRCTAVIGVYPGPIDTAMAAELDVHKTPASVVADAALDAVEAGQDYVFPDDVARELHEHWQTDAEAQERQLFAEAAAV